MVEKHIVPGTPAMNALARRLYGEILELTDEVDANIALTVIEGIAQELLSMVKPELREEITDIFCKHLKEGVRIERHN